MSAPSLADSFAEGFGAGEAEQASEDTGTDVVGMIEGLEPEKLLEFAKKAASALGAEQVSALLAEAPADTGTGGLI